MIFVVARAMKDDEAAAASAEQLGRLLGANAVMLLGTVGTGILAKIVIKKAPPALVKLATKIDEAIEKGLNKKPDSSKPDAPDDTPNTNKTDGPDGEDNGNANGDKASDNNTQGDESGGIADNIIDNPNNPLANTDPKSPDYKRSWDPNLAVKTVKEKLEAAGIDADGMSDQDLLDLMWDPATKKYEPGEVVQALRLKKETGIDINGRAAEGMGDIKTSQGNIDLMGAPEDPKFFNLDRFKDQIRRHADKSGVDKTAIDMTNVPASMRKNVIDYVKELNDQGKNIITFGL